MRFMVAWLFGGEYTDFMDAVWVLLYLGWGAIVAGLGG
jgi:hypothetical protein